MTRSKIHPAEIRARRYEAKAARAARRGDGRGAEDYCRMADAVRREHGLPLPHVVALRAAVRHRGE